VKTGVERYLKRRATASTRGRQIWLSAIQPILNGEEFAGAAECSELPKINGGRG
jgi:hypothetical protein